MPCEPPFLLLGVFVVAHQGASFAIVQKANAEIEASTDDDDDSESESSDESSEEKDAEVCGLCTVFTTFGSYFT